ncbi:hypothetical protein FQN50_005682 [Emmonsiellopsis sp. PD_5]|nr:hypothetical protein FQN50_005682 [Emmonsiellopsis sp. PD_5]
MHFLSHTFILASICATGALSDLLTPLFPPPGDLTSDQSLVAKTWANFSSTLESQLKGGNPSKELTDYGVANLTFSVGMFSIRDPSAAESLQLHYTTPEVAGNPESVNEVDGDTIYRVASITKAFTVFAGMIELDCDGWDRPLSELIPGLAEYTQTHSDPVMNIQWDKITPRALAAQIAGLPREGLPYALDIADNAAQMKVFGDALPPLDADDPTANPPCSVSEYTALTCPGDKYIEGVRGRSPTFLPWGSPVYTNNGFTTLGLALASITGKSLDTIYSESIFKPLGLTGSFSKPPPVSEYHRSAIPVNATISGFEFDGGITQSSGGIWSTTNDLAKFGVGILNSTLLEPDVTRKWLKPVSHTSHLEYSVGSPWEIHRYQHPSGRVTDMYTKLGDSGFYGGTIVLIPDYDVGFSVLGTTLSALRSSATFLVADMVAETMLPALEAQAMAEANRNFVGTYASTIDGLDSSVTFALNETDGVSDGLLVTEWISRGVDLLTKVKSELTIDDLRVVPTITEGGCEKVSFRFDRITKSTPKTKALGIFTKQFVEASGWITLDVEMFGGLSLLQFVFDVDQEGKASAVSLPSLRIKLERKE